MGKTYKDFKEVKNFNKIKREAKNRAKLIDLERKENKYNPKNIYL